MKLLKFYADWCGPCKQQSKILENCSIEVIPINVEEEENESIIEKYGVKNLPVLILLDEDENQIARFNGLTSLDKINSAINETW